MPSVIGSTTIFTNDLVATTITGPTGPTGSIGPLGPTGATGITVGATGNVGVYILDVNSNLKTDTISFKLSNGISVDLTGFKGPTYGTYANSKGVCNSTGSVYISVFSGISSGQTFSFLGISGTQSSGIVPVFSEDNTKILLNFSEKFDRTVLGICGSSSGYLLYVDENKQIKPTTIGVTSYYFSPLPAEINGITNTNFLNFNEIKNQNFPINSIQNYVDLDHKIYTIPAFPKNGEYTGIIDDVVVAADPKYGLDIVISEKYSAYYIETPNAIKSITFSTGKNKTNLERIPEKFKFLYYDENYEPVTKEYDKRNTVIDHVVFFINNGAEIWNIPSNIGILNNNHVWQNNASISVNFTAGMNIVNVFNLQVNEFNPPEIAISFFERSLGYSGPYHYRYEGSCCYSDDEGIPRCLENSTLTECETLNGKFNSLENCKSACVDIGDGYCCHPKSGCILNVSPELCSQMGGNYVRVPSPVELANAGTPLDPGSYYETTALCSRDCNTSEQKASNTEITTINFKTDRLITTYPGTATYVINPYDLGCFSEFCYPNILPTNSKYISIRDSLNENFAEFIIKQPDTTVGINLYIYRPETKIRRENNRAVEFIDLNEYLNATCVGCGALGEDVFIANITTTVFYNNQRIKLFFKPEKITELVDKLSYNDIDSDKLELYRPIVNVFYVTFKPNITGSVFFYLSADLQAPPPPDTTDPTYNIRLLQRYSDNSIFYKFGLIPTEPEIAVGACYESNKTKYYQGIYEATRKCLFCQNPDGKTIPLQYSSGTISACISTDPEFYWTDSAGNKKYYKINCIRGITAYNINDCSYSLLNNPLNPNSSSCKHALYEDVLPVKNRTGYNIVQTTGNNYELVTTNPYDCVAGTDCYESVLYQDDFTPVKTCKGFTNGSYYYDEIKTNVFDFAIANLPGDSPLPYIIRDQLIEELKGITFNYQYTDFDQFDGTNPINLTKKLLHTWEGTQYYKQNDSYPTELDGLNKKCCTASEVTAERTQFLTDMDLLNQPLNPCKCDTEQFHLGPPDESIFNFNGHKTQVLDFYNVFSTTTSDQTEVSYKAFNTNTTDTYKLTDTPDLTIKSISSGYWHLLGLDDNKNIVAWGAGTTPVSLADLEMEEESSTYDRTGINQGQSAIPGDLIGVPVSKISAGAFHSAAVDFAGNVYCWGAGLINDPVSTPSVNRGQSVVPSGLTDVIDISLGGFHTVALKSDGTVVCWGYNYYGQCNVPAGLTDVVSISAGAMHTVAVKSDGTVYVWGFTTVYDNIGDYRQKKLSSLNGNIILGIKQIVSGYGYTAILKTDNTVDVWGGDYRVLNLPPSSTATKIAASRYSLILLTPDSNIIYFNEESSDYVSESYANPADIAGTATYAVVINNKSVATSAEEYEYWVYATYNSNSSQCNTPYQCAVPCNPQEDPLCLDDGETETKTGKFTEWSLRSSMNTLFFKMKIDPLGNLVSEKPECIIIKPGCYYSYGNNIASSGFYAGLGGANCFIDYSSEDYTCADNDGTVLGGNSTFSNPSFRYIGRIKKAQTKSVVGSPDLGLVVMTPNFARDAQAPIGNADGTFDGCWFTIGGAASEGCNGGNVPCSAARECESGPPPDVCKQASKWMIQYNQSGTNSPYLIDMTEFKNESGQSLTEEEIKIIKYAKEQYFKNALLSAVCKNTNYVLNSTRQVGVQGPIVKKELSTILCSPETNNCGGGAYSSAYSGFWANASELGFSVNSFCSNVVLNNKEVYDIIISIDKTTDSNYIDTITPTIFKINKNNATVTKDTDSYLYYTNGETTDITKIKSGESITVENQGYSKQLTFFYTDGSNKEFFENEKQISYYLIFDNVGDTDTVVTDIGLNFNSIVVDYNESGLGFIDSVIKINYKPVGSLDLTKNIIKNRVGVENYVLMQFTELNYITWKPKQTLVAGSKNSFEKIACTGCEFGSCGLADECLNNTRYESADSEYLTIHTNGLTISDGVDLTGKLFIDGIVQYKYDIILNDKTITRTYTAYRKDEKYFENGETSRFVGLLIDDNCMCVNCSDPANFEICSTNRYCNDDGSC